MFLVNVYFYLHIVVDNRRLAAFVLGAHRSTIEVITVFVFLARLAVGGNPSDDALRKNGIEIEKLEPLTAQRQAKVVDLYVAEVKGLGKIRLELLEKVQYHYRELEPFGPFGLRVRKGQDSRRGFNGPDVLDSVEGTACPDQLGKYVPVLVDEGNNVLVFLDELPDVLHLEVPLRLVGFHPVVAQTGQPLDLMLADGDVEPAEHQVPDHAAEVLFGRVVTNPKSVQPE